MFVEMEFSLLDYDIMAYVPYVVPAHPWSFLVYHPQRLPWIHISSRRPAFAQESEVLIFPSPLTNL